MPISWQLAVECLGPEFISRYCILSAAASPVLSSEPLPQSSSQQPYDQLRQSSTMQQAPAARGARGRLSDRWQAIARTSRGDPALLPRSTGSEVGPLGARLSLYRSEETPTCCHVTWVVFPYSDNTDCSPADHSGVTWRNQTEYGCSVESQPPPRLSFHSWLLSSSRL